MRKDKDNTVNFETYKHTHDLRKAQAEQRMYEWQTGRLVEFISQGRVSDATDLVAAGLLIKQNHTTNYEREYYNRMIDDVAKLGYEKEAEQIRWTLQKHLKIDKGESDGR